MTPSAALSDIDAGDITDFLLSLAVPHLHGILVPVTGDKFIAGGIVKIQNGPNGILGGPGDTDS